MRVLCAAVPGPGHSYPVLAVAQALGARGHQVTVCMEDRFQADAAAAGCAFVPLPVAQSPPAGPFEPYGLAMRTGRAFLPHLDAIGPDVAVADVLTLGAALACDIRQVPWATVVPHPLHLPSKDLPPFGSALPPARGRLGRWRHERMRRAQHVDLLRGRDECNAARAALGLAPLARMDPQISRDLIVVATVPALEPPRSDWPGRAHVVGPCAWDPPSEEILLPGGDGPLVLIASSTAHAGGMTAAAVQAVQRLGARAVVTAGANEVPPYDPDRVRVVRGAPHGALLRLVDAVVCNGGGGITARSLAAGVPLVVVAQHGDQKENGARAARTGAAIVAGPAGGAGGVYRSLRRVLRDPRFAQRAKQIARQSAGLGGATAAAALVEGMAGKQREAG